MTSATPAIQPHFVKNQHPEPRGNPAPLGVVLALTVVNSAAGFVISAGAHFIADKVYASTERQNAYMGLAYGIAYIIGAILVGPLNRLCARRAGPTPRTQLVCILALLSAGAAVPMLVSSLMALAVYAAAYGLLTGAMWPLTEAYLSGGRTGAELRRTIGRFNILWSGAIVACAWAMGPLNDWKPMMSVALIIPLHAAALLLALRLPARPAALVADDNSAPSHTQAELREYAAQLRVFRGLLLLSNALMASIAPLFPALLERLGFEEALKTPFLSIWLAARVAVFWVMERRHGWRGRRSVIALGCLTVFSGYALLMFFPQIATVAAGLALFGTGMGVIYCAALYYAMELGGGSDHDPASRRKTQIDEGGIHEALIGVGFTAGPLIAIGVSAILA